MSPWRRFNRREARAGCPRAGGLFVAGALVALLAGVVILIT